MKNKQSLQAIVSVAALVCIIAGWFPIFPAEISQFLYQKLFYILIGISFILMAPALANPKFIKPMYIAAGLCIIGTFIPDEHRLAAIKTIGLFAGVIISIFTRPKLPNQRK